MREAFIKTVRLMRDAGWPVSTGELVDFFRALQLVDFRKNDVLAAALCTLAKDRQSRAYLVDLFERLERAKGAENRFIPRGVDAQELLDNPPRLPQGEFDVRLDALKNYIGRELARLSTSPPGHGTGGIVVCGGSGGRVRDKSDTGRPAGGAAGVRLLAIKPDGKKAAPTNLQFKDLAAAKPGELDEIRKMLVSLGKRLAVKRGYRKKPAPSGSVDMRRTVRAAISRGGVPLTLKNSRRIPASPLIVTLCDLSGSVAPYSEFFLQVLTGLQFRFRGLRSFAFVDHVTEVTEMVKKTGETWPVTARTILREAGISLTGFSNYGQVWEHFHRQYQNVLNTHTTLIILGDARNNWQPDGADFFRSVTELCRHAIWLNPLPREKWAAGDCIMDAYAPYCSAVEECRNAFQLSRFIREIL